MTTTPTVAELLPCWTCRGRTFCAISHSSSDYPEQLHRCVNCKAIYPESALRTPTDHGELVERLLARVANGGPHEWGYRDPVTGEFIADNWPFEVADALEAATALSARPDAWREGGYDEQTLAEGSRRLNEFNAALSAKNLTEGA